MLLKKKNLVPIPEVVNDTDLLEGKVAMVIGGTGGIGRAITTELMLLHQAQQQRHLSELHPKIA